MEDMNGSSFGPTARHYQMVPIFLSGEIGHAYERLQLARLQRRESAVGRAKTENDNIGALSVYRLERDDARFTWLMGRQCSGQQLSSSRNTKNQLSS